MPCGVRDPRRQRHRCLHCRENHRKCDTNRPCQHCKQRNLKCNAPPASRLGMMVVAYQPRTSKEAISRILVHDSWQNLNIFFDAIKSTDSILLSAYRFEKIGTLVQENAAVFDTLSTFGAMYAKQNAHQPLDRRNIISFHQKIVNEMFQPNTLQDPTFLLRWMILGLMEIMTDETGDRWYQLVSDFRQCFPLKEYITHLSGALDPALLRALRVTTVFHDLLGEDSVVHPALEENTCDNRCQFGPHAEDFRCPEEAYDFLAYMLERWVYLGHRSSNWIKTMESTQKFQDRNSISLYSSLEGGKLPPQALEGLEIISIGCELQQEIISKMLSSSACNSLPNDHNGEFITPFYHWILTGICHMFTAPAWRSYDWKLPVMESSLVNEQALLALGGAEKMLERSHLDGIIYATISPIVGGKMSLDTDRQRLLRFLQNVRQKGFAAASSFEEELKLNWAQPAETG